MQAARLRGVFTEPDLFEPHLLNLIFELTILGPHSTQIEVVMPNVASAILSPHQKALERSDCTHAPDADQAGIFRIIAAAALDLHREPQHLQKQYSYKNDQVAVAAEDRFHNVSFKVSRFVKVARDGRVTEVLSSNLRLRILETLKL